MGGIEGIFGRFLRSRRRRREREGGVEGRERHTYLSVEDQERLEG